MQSFINIKVLEENLLIFEMVETLLRGHQTLKHMQDYIKGSTLFKLLIIKNQPN